MSKYFLILALLGCISAFAQTKQSTNATTGKQLYAQYCLACHQEDGEGVPNMNPPLTQTSYVLGDKKKLIAWVLQGSGKEKLPVDGNYYSNNMPSQAALKDDEIANILTYVRSHFDNKASAVTPEEVKAVRSTIK